MDKAYDYKELKQYRQNITQYSILSHGEICELIKKYRQGDREAGQQVINANLRFVMKVSQKYFKKGHRNLELIQEGNLGLIRAIDRFDPDRGIPLIGYAVWWIEAMIKTFLQKSSKNHTGNLGHAKGLYSLDEPVGKDDEQHCRVDFLPAETDIEMQYFEDERSRNISSLLKHCFASLSERETYIINKRFYNDPPQTLTEVAAHLGISKERVRQLQIRCMEKMKKVLEGRGDSLPELEAISTQTNQRYESVLPRIFDRKASMVEVHP